MKAQWLVRNAVAIGMNHSKRGKLTLQAGRR